MEANPGSLWRLKLLFAVESALLCLDKEAIPLVEVNALGRNGPVSRRLPYHALEDIVIGFVGCRRRIGMRQTQEVTQLGQEQCVVCPFLPTLLMLPTANKLLYFCLHK